MGMVRSCLFDGGRSEREVVECPTENRKTWLFINNFFYRFSFELTFHFLFFSVLHCLCVDHVTKLGQKLVFFFDGSLSIWQEMDRARRWRENEKKWWKSKNLRGKKVHRNDHFRLLPTFQISYCFLSFGSNEGRGRHGRGTTLFEEKWNSRKSNLFHHLYWRWRKSQEKYDYIPISILIFFSFTLLASNNNDDDDVRRNKKKNGANERTKSNSESRWRTKKNRQLRLHFQWMWCVWSSGLLLLMMLLLFCFSRDTPTIATDACAKHIAKYVRSTRLFLWLRANSSRHWLLLFRSNCC